MFTRLEISPSDTTLYRRHPSHLSTLVLQADIADRHVFTFAFSRDRDGGRQRTPSIGIHHLHLDSKEPFGVSNDLGRGQRGVRSGPPHTCEEYYVPPENEDLGLVSTRNGRC